MFKNKIRSLSIAVGLVAMLAIAAPGVTLAATGPSVDTLASITISAATVAYSVTTPNTLTFPATQLTGAAQTVASTAGTFDIGIKDASGTHAGWSITLAATTFTGTNSTSNVLPPTTALTVSSLTMTPGTGTPPANSVALLNVTPPIAVTTAGPASVLYNADPGTGMGTSTLGTILTLHLPAETIADTYTSTITVAIVAHLIA